MEVFTRFLYAFLSQIFLGFSTMLKGIGTGIKQLFDIKTYQDVLNTYKGDFTIPEWGLVVLVILFMFSLSRISSKSNHFSYSGISFFSKL